MEDQSGWGVFARLGGRGFRRGDLLWPGGKEGAGGYLGAGRWVGGVGRGLVVAFDAGVKAGV